MSELKEHLFCECDECIREYRGPLSNEMRPYYLKSEADKVIAELENRIAPKQSDKTLQERLNEVCKKHAVSTLQDLDWAFCESEKGRARDFIEAVKAINHHKNKRCLAMAKWCHEAWANISTPYQKAMWYRKWYERWLTLADKYKEGNV